MASTDSEFRRARPVGKLYWLTGGSGLFFLVAPTGGKLGRWKYCLDEKEKLMALGGIPMLR